MDLKRVTISVDRDSDKAYRALKSYFNMAYFFEKVKVRQSSFRGFHLEAFIPQELSFDTLNDFRLAFGDDVGRIAFDERSLTMGKPKQVLFDWKNGERAGQRFLGIKAIPKPFKNSHIPANKYRS
jgi:hypothetical protein